MDKSNRDRRRLVAYRKGKQLVLIRPYEIGLSMHGMCSANEVRNVADMQKIEDAKFLDEEIQLGAYLTESMSDGFKLAKYREKVIDLM